MRNYPPECGLAIEQELRAALDSAWAEYREASREEKGEARRRYEQELRRFAAHVMPDRL